MATNYNNKIVTDGLVLCLDAGDRKSYSGSGSTWTDRSGNGNDGTLTNGPTFSSNNGGIIDFDGTNDYVSVANSSSLTITGDAITLAAWVKYDASQEDWKGVIYKSSGNANGYQLFIHYTEQVAFGLHTSTGFTRPTSGSVLSANQWYYIVATYDGSYMRIYEDSVLKSTTSKTGTITSNNLSLNVGRSFSGEELSGSIAVSKIYNKALSAADILQNFNAQRGRFGI